MGFFAELGQLSKEHQKERHDESIQSTKALRERKADELETAIKNIQARGSLQPGQAGYIAPDDLKKELSAAQQQLTSLYQPHEAPDLLKRVKGIFQKPPAAQQGGVLKPGMTLNDVLAMAGPVPQQPKAGKVIGKPFLSGDKWYQIEEDEQGNFTRKILPGYTEESRLQELVRSGLTEDEAKKVLRIETGLEAKAAPTRKGYKYDAVTDEVIDQDTGERFTRDDVAAGIGGETVARMFTGQKKVAEQKKKEKEETATTAFNRRVEALDHSFHNALNRGDHAAANRYVASTKNDLVQAKARVETMDQNKKDALAGNQQAMLSLVANHIGMTLGAQKGARITRAVWEEAIQSAPWIDQKISKWFHTDENGDHIFDGYKGGVTLTPDQINQMVDLAHQKVGTLENQVKNMQTAFDSELKGTGTPTGGAKAPPTVEPELTPEEKEIQELINK